jgi:hypothetical protein
VVGRRPRSSTASRFDARISGLASGLALAVRPAGLAEVSGVKGLPEGTRPEGAPLTLEGPAQTMRGVPVPVLQRSRGFRRTRRDFDGLVVVLAGAAAGYGGDRTRPVTGGTVRGSRRAAGLASEGRGETCRPATVRSPVEPQPLTAGHPGRSFPLDSSRPSLAVHGLGREAGAPKVRP